MPPRRHWPTSVAAVLAAFVVGSCGDGDPGAGPTTTRSSATTVAPSPSTTAAPAMTTTTTSPAGRVVEYTYAGGSVEGDGNRVEVDLGERLTVRVTSDVTEEIHVHTYDHRVELEPGVPGEVTFEASIPGVHEVELELSHRLLFSLVVQ